MMSYSVKVALNLPIYHTFDYILPESTNRAIPGIRVEVPFGQKKMTGIIVSADNQPFDASAKTKYKLKKISNQIDENPIIGKDIMDICIWGSNYYQHPIGQVLFSSLPSMLRKGQVIDEYKFKKYLYSIDTRTNINELNNKPAQKKLYQFIKSKKNVSIEDLKGVSNDLNIFKKLNEKGFINKFEYTKENNNNQLKINLSSEQSNIFENIKSDLNSFNSFLIEGVTGSGKTELYIKISDFIASKKGQILIVVPEINLTPQTLNRFKKYLKFNVDSYHSSLTESEKLKIWLNTKNGNLDIIIGTRSSVFLPFKNLKTIIIDEEHDLSLKQQEKFKYHARDLSIMRAKNSNVPIILGSATPSFESLYNCENKKYKHLELRKRFFSTSLPKILLVDLNKDTPDEGLSSELVKQIHQQIKNKEQTLLFIGRRGFSHTLLCKKCGWVSKCDKCDSYMAYHSNDKKLWCHHCGFKKDYNNSNNCCNESELIPLGFGTERIEAKLKSLFPSSKILRIDSDNINTTEKLNDFIKKAKDGSIDILIGTQMLVKGHDFPNVSLVGIIDIDSGLHSIDFRGLERTAQLMIQVSGRSGRHKKQGRVIIQTRKPNHPLILELLKNGYRSFSKKALLERKNTYLPPYSYIALLKIGSYKRNICLTFLQKIKNIFDTHKNIYIFGPIPSPMAKKNNMYYFQLIIKSSYRKLLLQKSQEIREYIVEKKINNVRWSLDIDPLDLY